VKTVAYLLRLFSKLLPPITILLCASLGLSGCQSEAQVGRPVALAAQNAAATATFTPFQAASPTPRPTLTYTPTVVPSPTPAPCLEQQGRIEPMEEVVRDGRPPFTFRVYFPPCFSMKGRTRYPVLYMIHGQTYRDDQWERLGIGPAADALINEKKAPPFLIVMPLERNTFEDIYLSGFSRDVTEGLVSWIDANYPTCAERDCRAIGGLSRGGAWALHLGFTRWELFSAVGLHSTPPFSNDPIQFPIWIREIPPDQLPRVWMDSGRGDAWFSYASSFEAILTRYRVAHEWYIFNGRHEESYWTEHVAEYLKWYTGPWNDLPQE
jgi:enterochelin esterase-like enzyme